MEAQTYKGEWNSLENQKEKGSADPRDKVTWGGLGHLGTLLSPVGCDLKVVFSGKWVPLEGKG